VGEILKFARAEPDQLAQDEDRPALADDVERTRYWALKRRFDGRWFDHRFKITDL
jgi:hypothetical protein